MQVLENASFFTFANIKMFSCCSIVMNYFKKAMHLSGMSGIIYSGVSGKEVVVAFFVILIIPAGKYKNRIERN